MRPPGRLNTPSPSALHRLAIFLMSGLTFRRSRGCDRNGRASLLGTGALGEERDLARLLDCVALLAEVPLGLE